MSRRLLAAVAAAVLTVGLAACGDGGDGPVTEPPPEINAGSDDGGASDGDGDGATPSDGGGENGSMQAAPDVPPPDPADFAGMDENTPEGAEQAVRFYFANVYWGYQTGDDSRLRGLYGSGCKVCAKFSENVENIGVSGDYWGATEISDFGMKVYESSDFDHEVGYIFTVGEHSEAVSASGKSQTVRAVDYVAAVGVLWIEEKWVVGGMKIEES